MIKRDLSLRLKRAAHRFPAVTLTGPRQSGKSTLCRAIFPKHPYANLEAPDVRAFATTDPRGFLGQFPNGAVLDEIQRCPELPSYLQGMIDADPRPGRWILTGSQNLSLLESVSQSLAGRSAVLHLLPMSRAEVIRFQRHPLKLDDTLFSGSYPRIFDQKIEPPEWQGAYLATYIERDVRSIANVGDLATFQRFIGLCAGRTAQLLNLSALANDCGITQPTAKAWLSILEASFIVFRLTSFSGNISKRLVKMPKLHFVDTGLVCWLLGIRNAAQLLNHPLRGAIFETWVASEILKHRVNAGEYGSLHHFRDRHGNETDLIVEHADRLTLVEAKLAQTVTSDLLGGILRVRDVLSKVKACDAVVVYGGDSPQKRTQVSIVPWARAHRYSWA